MNFLGEQLERFCRGCVFDVMHVPVSRQMLPLRETLSQERPMLSFFDRNHEIGAYQVLHGALLWEPIGAASGDCQIFEGMQRERRDGADVVRPTFQGETARARYPIKTRAFGTMIEQLLGKSAPVVVARAKEKNRLHLFSLHGQAPQIKIKPGFLQAAN
jgi:hypothetical protein